MKKPMPSVRSIRKVATSVSQHRFIDEYVLATSTFQVPERSELIEWGRQMWAARNAFSREVLRCPATLAYLHEFLEKFVRREFRWDHGFDVSQKDVDEIKAIGTRLPGVLQKLKNMLNRGTRTRALPNQLVDEIVALRIRIVHQIAWYRQITKMANVRGSCFSLDEADRNLATYVESKQKIAGSCLMLVVKIAYQYRNDHNSLMELVQDGNIGLMKAADKFDYSRGLAFSTYATRWIHQTIRIGLQRNRMIRVPVDKLNRFLKCEAEIETLQQTQQATCYSAKLSSVLAAYQLKESVFLAFRQRVASFEQLKLEGSEKSVEFCDQNSTCVHQALEKACFREKLNLAIQQFSARRQLILQLRFGLDGHDVHSFSQISQQIGLSHQRVQQILAETLKALRDELSELESTAC